MNTNLKPKLQRFATASAFACPMCQEDLTLVESVSSVGIAILLTWQNSAMSIWLLKSSNLPTTTRKTFKTAKKS